MDVPELVNSGRDDLWLVFLRQRLNLIVIDQVILAAHAVLHGIEPLARLVGPRPVRQSSSRPRSSSSVMPSPKLLPR